MSTKLVDAIKQAALDAVAATKPMGVIYGTVTSVSPLLIQVDQKLTLDSDFLVLTKNVTTYTATGTATTSNVSSHSHTVTLTVTIDNGLKVGDGVIMIAAQGGQQYIVLDKVVSA